MEWGVKRAKDNAQETFARCWGTHICTHRLPIKIKLEIILYKQNICKIKPIKKKWRKGTRKEGRIKERQNIVGHTTPPKIPVISLSFGHLLLGLGLAIKCSFCTQRDFAGET